MYSMALPLWDDVEAEAHEGDSLHGPRLSWSFEFFEHDVDKCNRL